MVRHLNTLYKKCERVVKETVLLNILHSIYCVPHLIQPPHEKLFPFQRQFLSDHSIPSWLAVHKPLVEEVQLVEANLQYTYVCFVDGRESTVSICDLAQMRNMLLNRWTTDSI